MLRCTNAQGNSLVRKGIPLRQTAARPHACVSKEVVSTYTEGAESLRYAGMVGKKSL
jgi:hypothetical protein